MLIFSYLKGKIKQLLVAEDDGDIDDDFTPIDMNRNISSLGVRNFYIDVGYFGEITKDADITITGQEFQKRLSSKQDELKIDIDIKLKIMIL